MISRNSKYTIENAKKGAAYGGLFGSSLGMVAGLIEFHDVGFYRGLHDPRRLLTAVGLVIGVSAGAMIGTGLGLFGAKKKQRVCQPNIATDKTNELQNTSQTLLKK